jgi:hypothetical protein
MVMIIVALHVIVSIGAIAHCESIHVCCGSRFSAAVRNGF